MKELQSSAFDMLNVLLRLSDLEWCVCVCVSLCVSVVMCECVCVVFCVMVCDSMLIKEIDR